jgi:hypothetical protein
MKAYFFPSRLTSIALSYSNPSRYFRKSSQQVCSVLVRLGRATGLFPENVVDVF